MIIPIIIFLISLVGLFTMLSFQAWRIKAGMVTVKERSMPEIFQEKAIVHVKTNFRRSLQRGIHLTVMTTLKTWVVFSHVVSMKFRQYFPKTTTFFSAKPKPAKGVPSNSFFLHSVAEYKQKVKKFKQKVRESSTM
jgi:hypothetical protein